MEQEKKTQTIREMICAVPDEEWLERLIVRCCPLIRDYPLPVQKKEKAIFRGKTMPLLNQIRSAAGAPNGLLLMKVPGMAYYFSDWAMEPWDRFCLFSEAEILSGFQIIREWDAVQLEGSMKPGMRWFSYLEDVEVLELLETGQVLPAREPDWKEPNAVLDSYPCGEYTARQTSIEEEVLLKILECRLQRKDRPKPVADPKDHMNRLKWDVLYNRICLYRELKSVYSHLAEGEGKWKK